MTARSVSTQGQIGHERVNFAQILESLRDREFEARRQAGQMPHHGASIEELGFTHLRKEFDALNALMGGRLTLEQVPGDFLGITDEEINDAWGYDGGRLIAPDTIMLMCDEKYHEAFCKPLLASMPEDAHLAYPLIMQGGDRTTYHAVRFILFYQFLKRARGALWMMDVDALFNRSPGELFASIGDKDCAFRIRPGRIEPWNQFSAGIVGSTKNALPYFKAIAQYLTATKDRWFWGIDQFAMYAAYQHVKPSISFLDDKVFNLDCTPEGVVWILGGSDKFKMLDGQEFDPSIPQGRYAEKFRSFQ